MSDAWFIEKIAPDGVPEDGCHPDEASALKAFLNKQTSAPEAAHAITRAIEASAKPSDNLYRLWGLLIDALVELPDTQTPALVSLLDAIQRLPEPADSAGRRRGAITDDDTPADADDDDDDGFLWRVLPNFGHMWADEHKRDDWRDTLAAGAANTDAAERARLRQLHVKKAAVEARLAVADVGGIPLHWGYDCIADALERRDAVPDFETPAAAQWLAIAGQRLRAGAARGEKSWALERKRDFGKEAAAMSAERWAFWETRLQVLHQQAEATLEAAAAAASEMKALGARLSAE
jgi:hypothetical protein